MAMDQEFWRRAFRLAYFIHCDSRVALCVVVHGMELMALKAIRQDDHTGANLMKLTRPQLFQVGLLEASKFYEQRQEREQFGLGGAGEAGQSLLELLIDLAFSAESLALNRAELPLNEEDLVVRYIKHLVQVTVSRNAYQVMIGISQFLYHHGLKEMDRIHLHIDPDLKRGGVSGKAYKISRRRIWDETVRRFGELLAIRGTGRFHTQERTLPLFALVNECLNHLALWDAECNKFSDEPHQAHALIHPACYDRIIKRLPIKNPTANLIIPQFVLPANNNNRTPRPDRRQPPELTAEQLRLLQQVCDKLGRRRKESEPVLLLVVVDGVERARFDPRTDKTVACRLKAGARIIEVYSREADGDLLLASCWLAELADDGEEHVTARTRAEGGQAIRFDIAFAEDSGAMVEVSFRETRPLRWLALAWQRLTHGRAARLPEPAVAWVMRLPKPAIAWAMAAMGVIGLLLFFWLRHGPDELPRIVRQPSPAIIEPSPSIAPEVQPSPSPPQFKPRSQSPALAERRKSRPSRDDLVAEQNRLRRNAGLPLRSVVRVHVPSLGADEFSRRLRESLVEQLRQSRLAVEEQISPATDAVLQRAAGSNKRLVTLRLVNRAGEVLWQIRVDRNRKRLSADRLAARVVNALLKAVREGK